MPTNDPINRKLRMALVGGGQGAFIGRVHATAAVLDNRAALVAGALSSNPEKAKASAPDFDIPSERAYGSFQELIDSELRRPESERIDFVSVATPNHTHFEIAKAAVEAGFNCMCDKPMTFDLAQAEQLAEAVDASGVVFAVTHNYTGYPLVRQARQMVLDGELGEIQAIRSSYIQGWLRSRLEKDDQKQAAWRTDPSKSGAAGCFGDIGTHAYNLGRYMTGLMPQSVSANLVHIRARPRIGRLRHGRHTLRKRRLGHGHGLADQPRPRERLVHRNRRNQRRLTMAAGRAQPDDGPPQRTAASTLYPRPQRPLHQRRGPGRLPFAGRSSRSLLRGVCERLPGRLRQHGPAQAGRDFEKVDTVYPNVNDGVEGMYFIQQCVASSQQDGAWLPLRHARARK